MVDEKKDGASFHRGRSKQDVQTPGDFLEAVSRKFGIITLDLAATNDNRVAEEFIGPGSSIAEDFCSFEFDFGLFAHRDIPIFESDVFWLNPEFGNITPFAKNCAEQLMDRPGHSLVLVPASTGTIWFQEHVHLKSMVYFLRPRLTFVGHKNPYIKDLILCAYGFGASGYVPWKWK